MSNLPVSSLIRQGGFDTEDGIEAGKRKSKDEYRKQKDLEEQRKAGTAPAMVDIETGRDINPHIPEFIEKAPWYIPHSGPTLKHQRPQPDRQKEYNMISEWYPKGTTDRVAFKYREGACENCGGMGHRKKDCFEKPRVVGAKWSNTNIAPDDHSLPKLSLDWDAKRDRWNGYNADDYKFVVQEYEKMDETRKLIRAEQLKGTEEEKNLEQDEDIYAEDASAPGQSVDMDSRTRITVRNLRIREDTAKYLHNLDTNGPFYDPKSRSMRENPFKDMPGKEQEAAQYAGENFMRYTGEVAEANEAQVFAWQARCKGIDIHSLAEPTRLEALKKEFEQQKEQNKSSVQNELLEKYGGKEHLSAPPKELLLAQSENYVEYNRKGKVIKGDEGPSVKSKYEEDALINNHTSVWGSYWRDGHWGYRCCHQFLRNSYCLGEQGILVEQTELGPISGAFPEIDQKSTKTLQPSSAMQNAIKNVSEEIGQVEGSSNQEKQNEKDESPDVKSEHSHSDDEEGSGDDENNEDDIELDEEELRLYEEQIENEQRKKLRDEKRRETKRKKRKNKKEKAKQRKDGKRKRRRKSSSSSKSSSSNSDEEKDENDSTSDEDLSFASGSNKKFSKELKKAIKKQLDERKHGKEVAEMGERKRKFHSGLDDQTQKPSEIDREAYNLTRIHSADPLAKILEEKEQKKMAKKAKRGE
ncbi:hypothetical protein ACQ4LE_001963 [Meloidogyne hapla]|uniref:Pre-mRNA-splicing factor SLU7 n=1 Tax=Meloidogyne hapla TaxID=6305 RepID=A0A1I8BV60_MELHA